MNMSKPDELGEKLPESTWLHHKDTLYRLYITEKKSLSHVKKTMEDEHGFPPQRPCDYEVALRDILHFRKNLKQEEWRAIEIHISNRKRQAKESEVIWNNTPFEAKKVRKELLRNSKPKSGLIRKVNPELPRGLVIRTPPRSPATRAAILVPSPKPQLRNTPANLAQAITGGSNHQVNSSSVADEDIYEVQRALAEAGEFGVSPYRKLRENLPFNRCMSQILELETWTPAFPRLFGANPSWELFGQQIFQLSNKHLINYYHRDDIWFFKWVGISADFALLRAFFSINSPTAGAVYESLLTHAYRLMMGDLLQVLFELRHVLRPNNASSFNEAEFVHVAVNMHSLGSRSGDDLHIVNTCLSNKPPRSITKQEDRRKRAISVLKAASCCDISILRVLVDSGWQVDSEADPYNKELVGRIMNQIYNWDPQYQDSLSDYLGILLRGGVLNGSALLQSIDDDRPSVITEAHDTCSITWEGLLMTCPPIMRKALHMAFTPFSGDQGTRISRAGVFMVAQDGAIRLRDYLEAHQEDDPFLTRVTLEECLLFTAILNDLETAAVLLEVGVDPHVGILSKNLKGYQKGKLPWNPSTVAAAAGNLEFLALLLGHINPSSFLDSAPIHQLVHGETLWEYGEQRGMEGRLRRLSDLRRCYLGARGSTNTLNESGRSFETLKYIRSTAHAQGLGQRIDLEMIKAAVFPLQDSTPWRSTKQRLSSDVLLMEGLIDAHLEYKENGMDLLHLSIRNHCTFRVVRFLLGKGLKVHSRPDGQNGNSMLHDALLSQSPDRSEIVEMLLREGADCTFCGEGLTILEASLWDKSSGNHNISRAEYQRIFERLFSSGAPVHHWPRKRLKEWRPVICLLLDVQASDDLILRVVDAGAAINACGYGSWFGSHNATPLQAAVSHRREGLAMEFIRRGADVHAPASLQFGFTALQAACHHDLPIHFLEYLVVGLGVHVDEPSAKIKGPTSLTGAVANGSLNAVEFLLTHGADVNATCRWYYAIFPGDDNPRVRPLDIAVFNGSLDKVELLLKAGGRSRDAGLGGAIGIAAQREHFAVLSVLQSWDEKHRRQILEEEALWQRQNPEQALMLSEPTHEELMEAFEADHIEDED